MFMRPNFYNNCESWCKGFAADNELLSAVYTKETIFSMPKVALDLCYTLVGSNHLNIGFIL